MAVSPAAEYSLAIIVPVFNDRSALENLLAHLLLQLGETEVVHIVEAESNSNENCRDLASGRHVSYSVAAKGRGNQMASAVREVHAERYWFVHADSIISVDALQSLRLTKENWGYYTLLVDDDSMRYRVLSWFIRTRFCLTKVITGDAGLFVDADLLSAVGGVPETELMEDVLLSKALRKLSSPIELDAIIKTSSRRWKKGGFVKTILLMWSYRLRFFFGASPNALVAAYDKNS